MSSIHARASLAAAGVNFSRRIRRKSLSSDVTDAMAGNRDETAAGGGGDGGRHDCVYDQRGIRMGGRCSVCVLVEVVAVAGAGPFAYAGMGVPGVVGAGG